MGFWGWRQLLAIFISVWVVGCSQTNDTPPPVSTTQPPVTLIVRTPVTVVPSPSPVAYMQPTTRPYQTPDASSTPYLYTLRPDDRLPDIARRFDVSFADILQANRFIIPNWLTPGQQITIPAPKNSEFGIPIQPTPQPQAVTLSSPTCYRPSTGGILCFGTVENPLDITIGRVVVAVQLSGRNGQTVATQVISAERRSIAPGTVATYRALFTNVTEDVVIDGVAALLLRADPITQVEYRSLGIESVNGTMNGTIYTLSAVVTNPTDSVIHAVRLSITLHDSGGRVIGYRMLTVTDAIQAGETIHINTRLIPQTHDMPYSTVLHAEGWVDTTE